MNIMFPEKLNVGDEVRIIAPSCAKSTLSADVIARGVAVLEECGLRVTWGTHTADVDEFECSSVSARVQDLHDAFRDANVKAVIAVRGGFYANQLLEYIDWSIIKQNPKIFCGFSDITVLQNAILAKTGLVTYSGPNVSSLGKSESGSYTKEYFIKCLFGNASFALVPALQYQNLGTAPVTELTTNPGWFSLSLGTAEGRIVGGNLCTLNLLQGTEYMPSLVNTILLLEDDLTSTYRDFDRNFQSLLHVPGFSGVQGMVFGRFQNESGITKSMLERLVAIRPGLKNIPIVANVDFGHTEPKITFPVGGYARVVLNSDIQTIEILKH